MPCYVNGVTLPCKLLSTLLGCCPVHVTLGLFDTYGTENTPLQVQVPIKEHY